MNLHEGETIVLEGHPERSILKIWFFTKSIVYLFFASFMTFWAFGFFGGMFSMATENNDFNPVAMGGGFTLVVAIIMLPLSLFYISALQKTFHYIITNRRCVFQGGIIKRTERSIPLHKITDVEKSENIVERMLGVSKVKVFTPGTASMNFSPFGRQSPEITYEGLAYAEEISEAINNQVRLVRQSNA